MFKDRVHAGKLLGEKLTDIIHTKNSVILAIPRGGVIIGNEIVKKLNVEFDVIVSKKITPPNNSEFAIGAILHDGTIHLDPNWKKYSNEEQISEEIEKKKKEVQRRLVHFRKKLEYVFDENKTVIIVDDGIATGSTVMVIIKWLFKKNIKDIVLAVPVMSTHSFELFKQLVNKVVVLEIPPFFVAVSQFYEEFDQVSDEQVIRILTEYEKSKLTNQN